MVRHLVSILLAFGLVAAVVPMAAADDKDKGSLEEFEREAGKESRDKPEHRHHHDHCDDDEADDMAADFVFGIFKLGYYLLGPGGAGSLARVQGADDPAMAAYFKPREAGELLIPYLAVDTSHHRIESDVSALELRGEAGYGPLGIDGRFTRFSEKNPENELDMIQIHGLYRMSLSSTVELDLGLGSTALTGRNSNSGFSMTFPLRVQATSAVGGEFRPAWSWMNGNTISDYTLGLSVRHGFASIRGGYRWVAVGSASLTGPYLGLSFAL